MSNDELLALVRNTDKRDSWRLEALDKLISNLALDHLYRLVNDTDRKDDWRKRALDAICEAATLQRISAWSNSVMISVGGSSIEISTGTITLSPSAIAAKAADILFRIVNDTDRKDEWRYQCLQYLIRIRHTDYLKRIANNHDRRDDWRDEAMRALIHG